MPATVISLTDPVSTLVTKTNIISTDVGDRSTLGTTDKTDLVSAINEVNGKILSIDTTNEIATAVETFFDGSNRFDIGGLTIDSGIVNHILKFNDDSRLVFGTDSDYHMYHSDSDQSMNLVNLNSGKNLNIQSGQVRILNEHGNKQIITRSNGLIEFHYAMPNSPADLGEPVMTVLNTGIKMKQFHYMETSGIRFSEDPVRPNTTLFNIKPLQIKNSAGAVVYAGYLVSSSSDSATL